MEEIITVDGRQFKLSTDRPLTAEQKVQTIVEIRKQTGCGTCGPNVAKMDNDWQYGGVRKLTVPQTPSATVTCPTLKQSLQDITLGVTPTGGVRPYTAWFYIKHNTEAPYIIPSARLAGATNPAVAIEEDILTTRTYTLNDLDVSSATGDSISATAFQPSDVSDAGVLSFNATALNLAVGSIRFISAIRDSCAAVGGPGTCAQWCDVTTACVPPTCGFVVS